MKLTEMLQSVTFKWNLALTHNTIKDTNTTLTAVPTVTWTACIETTSSPSALVHN